MEAWKMLDSWNELLEKFKREEVTRDDMTLFVMGLDVMARATYQTSVAADNEWRLLLLAFHERQTAALEAIAAALQGMVKS